MSKAQVDASSEGCHLLGNTCAENNCIYGLDHITETQLLEVLQHFESINDLSNNNSSFNNMSDNSSSIENTVNKTQRLFKGGDTCLSLSQLSTAHSLISSTPVSTPTFTSGTCTSLYSKSSMAPRNTSQNSQLNENMNYVIQGKGEHASCSVSSDTYISGSATPITGRSQEKELETLSDLDVGYHHTGPLQYTSQMINALLQLSSQQTFDQTPTCSTGNSIADSIYEKHNILRSAGNSPFDGLKGDSSIKKETAPSGVDSQSCSSDDRSTCAPNRWNSDGSADIFSFDDLQAALNYKPNIQHEQSQRKINGYQMHPLELLRQVSGSSTGRNASGNVSKRAMKQNPYDQVSRLRSFQQTLLKARELAATLLSDVATTGSNNPLSRATEILTCTLALLGYPGDNASNNTDSLQSHLTSASGVGGPNFSAPAILAHPDEFKNPSSFLKIYGDPMCGVNEGDSINGSTSGDHSLHPVKGKNGNWMCDHCNNINFPRRFRCNKCNTVRGRAGDAIVSDYAKHVYKHHLNAFRLLASQQGVHSRFRKLRNQANMKTSNTNMKPDNNKTKVASHSIRRKDNTESNFARSKNSIISENDAAFTCNNELKDGQSHFTTLTFT